MENTAKSIICQQLKQGLTVFAEVAANAALHATLAEAAEITANAMKHGRKLMVAGNGGSAADAQHLVAEFVSRLTKERPALRAVALTTDTSILTAIGNDYSFEHSFERQIEAVGWEGDVFIGISTSGNSANILRAFGTCRDMGIFTIGLTGQSGGKMAPFCDYLVRVPSSVTMYIQQVHLALEHIFCLIVERTYFGEKFAAAAIATTKL